MKNLDCSGLQCPGPIMKVNAALNEMENNEILKVSANDVIWDLWQILLLGVKKLAILY